MALPLHMGCKAAGGVGQLRSRVAGIPDSFFFFPPYYTVYLDHVHRKSKGGYETHTFQLFFSGYKYSMQKKKKKHKNKTYVEEVRGSLC